MSEKKPTEMICPMLATRYGRGDYQSQCAAENCAWWCCWNRSCALVAIPVEISNRLEEIGRAICN